ncbi:hypothetical protein A2U01_0029495, partial [Trifolium medium]|nr:hypothetical protein [Trifolium medium]
MVPPAPNVDLYKPRKRKRLVKASEQEGQKEEVKKEEVKKEEDLVKKKEDRGKEILQSFPEGKFFDTTDIDSSEAQINPKLGHTIPLTTLHPQTSESIANLFIQKLTPDLKFLEKHPSPDHFIQHTLTPENQQGHIIDPSLLQPFNVITPPKISDLPKITSETDLDTVAEGLELAT